MSLYILVPKSGGFCGGLRAFRGTREEAEDYFFELDTADPARGQHRRDKWDVLQFAPGCLLGPRPQLKEVESSDGPATGSDQPEPLPGEAPIVDRKALPSPIPWDEVELER